MIPVKGRQGTRVEPALVTKAGFADDRLFSMLEPDGVPLDQSDCGASHGVWPSVHPGPRRVFQ